MGELLDFNNNIYELRRRCRFIVKTTKNLNEDLSSNTLYPSIALEDIDTKIVFSYTKFDKFIINLNKDSLKKSPTYYGYANSVCIFLNYLLEETTIAAINMCTVGIVRKFLVCQKDKYSGETWHDLKKDVMKFLVRYYEIYKDKVKFEYKKEDFIERQVVVRDENNRESIHTEYKKLGIQEPRKEDIKIKNRFLAKEYVSLIIYEAKKYDEMLAFPIGMQAYTGIREGGVANLTVGDIKTKPGPAGIPYTYKINLNSEADFWIDSSNKTNPGSIKKTRDVSVHKVFFKDFKKLYDEHIALLESKGYPTDANSPLFYNSYGDPMTVYTYSIRLKKLFYERFLPKLTDHCIKNNLSVVDFANIEEYKKDYPGAHMFRHWFTMYLYKVVGLEPDEIADLRGDSSVLSMKPYLHLDKDIEDSFCKSLYKFQTHILEASGYYD